MSGAVAGPGRERTSVGGSSQGRGLTASEAPLPCPAHEPLVIGQTVPGIPAVARSHGTQSPEDHGSIDPRTSEHLGS